ncbi:MAG TPA: gliding motility-associated lipoprotein [Saprospirales bacterium]|nr:gliding motility-associated lipoprotein [Saprospirales bacterium]HRQ29633.1 SUMF1/EgtB/PvdO family nonheme iron enzyme [Saprospiraceae bacterium]
MKRTANLLMGLVLVTLLITSCGKRETGQLTGVQDRPAWKGINPYGMVYIPSGHLHVGQNDQDMFSSNIQKPKSVSVVGFFMDDTEITNNEYRQFVEFVRDSVARVKLDMWREADDKGNEYLDKTQEIDWSDDMLDDMFYQGDMAFDGKREFNNELLIYRYQWIDWNKAASRAEKARTSVINKEEVAIYPDTLSWVRDFAYSYNEPFARNYFWHPAFDDYPVVGVDWKMTKAFNHWRTKLWNTYEGNGVNTEEFRLPFESEWEYAARGGHELAAYPWGSYYVRNAKGCPLANFKPMRGNYGEDGGIMTVVADAYFANDYGLYNMAGNVAEWTESAYYDYSYQAVHDLNPNITFNAKDTDPEALKRKVVRGGSWKDIAYYLQNGTRTYEFQDSTKSYIGYRCALTYLGRSINDF